MGKHVIQIYLNDEEYEFLKRCSEYLGKSMAKTMLHLADFKTRMREEHEPAPEGPVTIQGIPFTEKPFEDYEF